MSKRFHRRDNELLYNLRVATRSVTVTVTPNPNVLYFQPSYQFTYLARVQALIAGFAIHVLEET